MRVYIDLLLFLNFGFDFLLLLSTAIVLRRNVKIFNVLLGAFVGSFSILVLFLNINSLQLFLIKVYLSIIMCLITFNYVDFKYTLMNVFSFYLVSILLGGFLYLLNIEFSYKHDGLIFYNSGLGVNVIVLFIFAPIILYIYIKHSKYLCRKVKNYYNVCFKIGKNEYKYVGYLDSGNTLKYGGKPVIITNVKIISNRKKEMIPFTTIGHVGILECILVRAFVYNLGEFDVWLGYCENFNISGAQILLNSEMEG